MKERWKTVDDHVDYTISSRGRVISSKKNKDVFLKPGINSRGYECVSLDGKSVTVHKLVAKAFLDNPNDYKEINHKDGDKTNNVVTNLEWCNRSYNLKHAYDNKLRNSIGSMKACSIPIMIVETGETFPSISSCARYLGVTAEQVRCCVDEKMHQHHTCRGYHFKIIDKEAV